MYTTSWQSSQARTYFFGNMQSAFNSLLRRLYFVTPLKNSEKNFSGLKKRPKGAKSDLRKVLLGASFFKSAQIRRF